MLILIVFSFIVLAARDHFSHPLESTNLILFRLEIVLYVFFLLEFLIKSISNGFALNGWNSYLLSPINMLDFVLLVIEPIYLSQNQSFPWKVLRLLRFFFSGPYSADLILILQTTLFSLPNLIKLAMIFVTALTIFAVFGKKYLKSLMFSCTEFGNSFTKPEIHTNTDCMDYGGDWLASDLNFDNFVNAYLTLFFVSGSENWIPIL